jgi:ribonuclease D
MHSLNDDTSGPRSETTRKISREEINELPIRRYEGPVCLVKTPAELKRAVRDISQEGVVGFDTETRPAFTSGESYLPSLVQLATREAVYLLQVQQQDYSVEMREVLSSETIVKTGVSVRDDLINLKRLFAFEEKSVVDLGKVAKSHGMQQTGVRNLAGIFLGARIPKGATTTNWAARHLTDKQIVYAATDAWACRELYLRFEQLNLV